MCQKQAAYIPTTDKTVPDLATLVLETNAFRRNVNDSSGPLRFLGPFGHCVRCISILKRQEYIKVNTGSSSLASV